MPLKSLKVFIPLFFYFKDDDDYKSRLLIIDI